MDPGDILVNFCVDLLAASFWAFLIWFFYTRDKKHREETASKIGGMRLNLCLRKFITQVERKMWSEQKELKKKSRLDDIPELKRKFEEIESILPYITVASEIDDRDRIWEIISSTPLETWLRESRLLAKLDEKGERWDSYAEYVRELRDDLLRIQDVSGVYLPLEISSILLDMDSAFSMFFSIFQRFERDEITSDMLARLFWVLCRHVLSLRQKGSIYGLYEAPTEAALLLRSVIDVDRKKET